MREIRMFVNGQAMQGGSMAGALTDAVFIGPARTAPRYLFFSFFSVRDEFPGLHPVDVGGGSIAGELYAVSYSTLRENLLPFEPAELELGIIELEDGSGTLAMRMRAEALTAPGVVDITAHGGWRAYLGDATLT